MCACTTVAFLSSSETLSFTTFCVARTVLHQVKEFLSELSGKLTPLADKDMSVLLKLKQGECKKRGLPFDGKINNWDSSYFRNMVEKEHYQVDHEQIKTYFPLERVTKGLLDIYQELLSLTFVGISAATWHEEASLPCLRALCNICVHFGQHGREKGWHVLCFVVDPHSDCGNFTRRCTAHIYTQSMIGHESEPSVFFFGVCHVAGQMFPRG